MHAELVEALAVYGLRDKEAQIYLTVLELGSGSAATIARLAGIKRVTTYAILEEMVKKGCIHKIMKSNTSTYSAVPPSELLALRRQQCVQFEQLLPLFENVRDKYNNKPRVDYYEGVQGVKDYYEQQLIAGENMYAFLGLNSLEGPVEEYLFNDYVPRRVKLGLSAKVILPASEANKKYVGLDEASLRETIMIDNPLFTVATGITLFGTNKVGVAMWSQEEMSATIIQSEKFYITLKGMFDLLRELYHE